MKILATTALAFLVAFTGARAEDEISPARLALAKQVMDLNGSTTTYANYDKNLDQIVDQLRRSMPDADEAMIADIKKIAVEEFTAYKPTLVDGVVRIYAKHFSERDLKALIAFYKTDAGKHFAAELPAVAQESIQLNVPFTQHFMARLRQYVMDKIAAQNAAQSAAPNPGPAPEKSKEK